MTRLCKNSMILFWLILCATPTRGQFPTIPAGHFPRLKGNYLGQKAPQGGLQPFLPDIFAGNNRHGYRLQSSLLFSPDGQEAYFTNQKQDSALKTILWMKQIKGVWREPAPVSFSGNFNDKIGWFSPKGERLYFFSDRIAVDDNGAQYQPLLWVVQRNGAEWSDPSPIRAPRDILWNDGSFYLSADIVGGFGGKDVYLIASQNGVYQAPQNIGQIVNTPQDDIFQCVEKEGKFLIYYHEQEGNKSATGLYVTYRAQDKSWAKPLFLSKLFGLEQGYSTRFSPDGKYLFILNKNDGLYWIHTEQIESLGLLKYLQNR